MKNTFTIIHYPNEKIVSGCCICSKEIVNRVADILKLKGSHGYCPSCYDQQMKEILNLNK